MRVVLSAVFSCAVTWSCGAVVEGDVEPGDRDGGVNDIDSSVESGFVLSTENELCVRLNDRTDVLVTLSRADGYDESVALEVTGLPPGVSVDGDTEVAAGATSARIAFSATNQAPVGQVTNIIIRGTGAEASNELQVPLLIAGRRGTLDTRFGSSGRLHIPLATNVMTTTHDHSGEFSVIAGIQGNALVLYRVNDDGAPDTAFGVNGLAVIEPGALGLATINIASPLIDTSGTLWVVGTGTALVNGVAQTAPFITRLTPAGIVDGLFADNGVFLYKFDAAAAVARGFLGAGNLVWLTGWLAGDGIDGLLARGTSTGPLDESFAGAGWLSLAFAAEANDITVDGAVFGAGAVTLSVDVRSISRYWLDARNPDGTLLTTFGGGRVRLDAGVDIGVAASRVAPYLRGVVAAGSAGTLPALYFVGEAGTQTVATVSIDPGLIGRFEAVTAVDDAIGSDNVLAAARIGLRDTNHDVEIHSFTSPQSVDIQFGDGGRLVLGAATPAQLVIEIFAVDEKRAALFVRHASATNPQLYETWMYRFWF